MLRSSIPVHATQHCQQLPLVMGVAAMLSFELRSSGFEQAVRSKWRTRNGPAGGGDSMADFVGSRWMSSSSPSVSGLVNALLRVTLHIVLNPWSQLCCDVTGSWLSAFS